MIGAAFLSDLFGNRRAPPPRSEPVPRPGHRALAEVAYALANFQVIDEIVTAEGYVPTNRERLAHAFAAWALANAARHFVAAYADDVEDGGTT